MNETKPGLSKRDKQVPEYDSRRSMQVLRLVQRCGMIVWPRIRDTWIWCVEWTVGLTVWCLAGLNLQGRLALQRWSRALQERKSQRNSADRTETESAVTISMPAENAHSAAIDQRRTQFRAGPRRASNLSTTRRAAVSVVLLLLGWYCLTPGRDTNVTFDGSSISLTPQVTGPERNIAERTEPKTGRNPVSPSATVTDTDGDAATNAKSVPGEIALRLRVAERKRHDALQGLPREIIDAIENPDVDIRSTIDGVRDPSLPVNDELTQALVHQIAGLRTLNASFVAAQEIVDLEERTRVRETVAAQMLAIRRGGKRAKEELAHLQDSLGLTDAQVAAIVGDSSDDRRSAAHSASRPRTGRATGLHKSGYSTSDCLLCSEVRSATAKREFSDGCGFGFCDRCGKGLAALRTGVRLKQSGVAPSEKLNKDIRQFTDFMQTCFSRDDSNGRRGLILMSITSFATPEWNKLTGCGD